MKVRTSLAALGVFLTILACGVPSAASPPTLALPATPVFLPTPLESSPIPPPPTAPAATPFTGTWNGPDPDDGSTMTLTLVQSGNSLTGTYSDTYTGGIAPPGFEGTVSGTVLSSTTGQIALDVHRHDGTSLNLQANLALTGAQDLLTVTVTSAAASPWPLRRQ
jgi:hypothetical protein